MNPPDAGGKARGGAQTGGGMTAGGEKSCAAKQPVGAETAHGGKTCAVKELAGGQARGEKPCAAKQHSGHRIRSVAEDSIAWEEGVLPGMYLVSVNGTVPEDVFDYRFLMSDEHVDVLIREENGDETLLGIDKDESEDFGVEFESPLMDEYRSCRNHCIFCFIDQMPPGMRKTLYFKDDDTRLSFLQGNYVTLTNLSDADIDRIIRYRMEPINISVQTTNPELRARMLRNRFAGNVFGKMRRLAEAGIAMNGQIVLCRGWNDGAELDRTIRDLTEYLPAMRSVSVVPVGLSRFREGLESLEPFTPSDAGKVIDQIEAWQKSIWDRLSAAYEPMEGEDGPDPARGAPRHFIHASDEWYILAGRELPEEARYDGYLQYENGVGMLRLMESETGDAIRRLLQEGVDAPPRTVSSVCGMLAAPYVREVMTRIGEAFPGVCVQVCPVRNDFFGESITVTGLVTGGDLIRQMQERVAGGFHIGQELLVPVNMLRAGETVFLDDVTTEDVERALGVRVRVVLDSGEDMVRAAIGLPPADVPGRQLYEDAGES